jgi:hypothetical protein
MANCEGLKVYFSFGLDGDNEENTGETQVEMGTEIDDKHKYIRCTKYFLLSQTF